MHQSFLKIAIIHVSFFCNSVTIFNKCCYTVTSLTLILKYYIEIILIIIVIMLIRKKIVIWGIYPSSIMNKSTKFIINYRACAWHWLTEKTKSLSTTKFEHISCNSRSKFIGDMTGLFWTKGYVFCLVAFCGHALWTCSIRQIYNYRL